MPKRVARLYRQFQPSKYQLELKSNREAGAFSGHLEISGKKVGPPSKRLTFHQKKLKIKSAQIIRRDKKGTSVYEVVRINHLPTFEEVRLHTKELLYPGDYRVIMRYMLSVEKAEALRKNKGAIPKRDQVPSIDEPQAWALANLDLRTMPPATG